MPEYKFVIQFKSNFHVGSGFGFAQIIDNTTIKNAEGVVYIPASTIKGKLRCICRKIAMSLNEVGYHQKGTDLICDGGRLNNISVCKTRLSEACIICRLFGSVFQSGKLIFHDAQLSKEKKIDEIQLLQKINRFSNVQTETISGVKISRRSRTSDAKQLFNSENGLHTLSFEAKISTINDEDLKPREEELLLWGTKALTHLGGQKSRGLGRIETIDFINVVPVAAEEK